MPLAKHAALLPIAAETGPIFRKNPKLFAADDFHPTAAGYAVWQPIIDAGLSQMLAAIAA
ncbi:MAG: hypothetical protein WDN27_05345 [Candidatus Saccharibacteria bacterium]